MGFLDFLKPKTTTAQIKYVCDRCGRVFAVPDDMQPVKIALYFTPDTLNTTLCYHCLRQLVVNLTMASGMCRAATQSFIKEKY